RARLGQLEQSRAALDRAGGLLEQLVAELPADRESRRTLAACYRVQGGLLRGENKLPEAARAFQQAIALWERMLDETPDSLQSPIALANCLMNYCAALPAERAADAEPLLRRAVAYQEKAAAAAPRSRRYRMELSIGLDDLGALLWTNRQAREAEGLCR